MKVTVQSEPIYLIELTLKEAQLLKTYCDPSINLTDEMRACIQDLEELLDKQGVPSL